MDQATTPQPVGPPAIDPSSLNTGSAQPGRLTSQPSQRARSRAHTAEHLALLEDVSSRVTELEQLIELLGTLIDHQQTLAVALNPSDPELIQERWQHGLNLLTPFLDQPIQPTVDAQPVPLQEAADIFRQWTTTFRHNARGPGGEPFQDSPSRLGKFLTKLTDLNPRPAQLLRDGLALLGNPELNPAIIAREVTTLSEQIEQTAQHQAEIDQAAEPILRTVGPALVALRHTANSLLERLSGVANAKESSAQLTRRAHEAKHALEGIEIDALEQRLTSIQDWISKFRDDPVLTVSAVTDRIERDLTQPLAAATETVRSIEAQFTPNAVEDFERAHHQTLAAQVSQALGDLQERYQVLVRLRRTKLGTTPDERYFGTVAKQVNDTIAELGESENRLLAVQAELRDSTSRLSPQLLLQVRDATLATHRLMAASASFANPETLEKTLASAWRLELVVLDQPLVQAREQLSALRQAQQSPGIGPIDPAVQAELKSRQRQLETAVVAAEQLRTSDEHAPSPDRASIKATVAGVFRALRQAGASIEPLTTPAGLRTFVAEQTQASHESAIIHAHAQAQADITIWETITKLTATIERQRQMALGDLREVLGYATALEPYQPERATALYEQLMATVAVSVDLPAFDSRTLGDVLTDQLGWTGFHDGVMTRSLDLRAAELTIRELALLLGPAGRLQETLATLQQIAHSEPIAAYRQSATHRTALGRQLTDIERTLLAVTVRNRSARLDTRAGHSPTTGAQTETEPERLFDLIRSLRLRLERLEQAVLSTVQTELATISEDVDQVAEDIAVLEARQRVRDRRIDETNHQHQLKRQQLRERLQRLLVDQSSNPQPSTKPQTPVKSKRDEPVDVSRHTLKQPQPIAIRHDG